MIRPANEKIIVRCDLKQKDTMTVSGVTVKTATLFEVNYREKSPVVCEVVRGNPYVEEGDILLAHHNTFYTPSPYQLEGDLFSIPFKATIVFAIVTPEGDLTPIGGNIICQRIVEELTLPLPPELQKTHLDRALVLDGRGTRYKNGQTIFHRYSAGYDIVYIWQNIEKRVTKVYEDQVVGILH